MAETEFYIYTLYTEDREQSLRISLINNAQISMILTNIESNQRYIAYVTLDQLKEVCEVFNSMQTIQEAFKLLKETIEAENIRLTEDPQEKTKDLKYKIIIENQEYPPFDVKLELEEGEENNNSEDDVQILPPTFDYQGNKEAQAKYGETKDNTTEFEKPIIQSDVKLTPLILEYIEPIQQIHYPDGRTESHALPPRIQGVDGKMPDITEEQFQYIREQMDKNITIQNFSPLKNFLNNNRSNSVSKKNVSLYSTQSTPYPGANISRVNAFQNAENIQNQEQYRHTMYNNMPNMYDYLNNDMNKNESGYSTMTMQTRNMDMHSAQIPNPTLINNNLNNSNFSQKDRILNQSIMERRPRMKENHPRDATRSQSLPSHENMRRFDPNRNPNIYQDNPFQNPAQFNNNEKYPYDRNTQRLPNRNKINEKMPHNHRRKKKLEEIQKHKKKLEEVQKKLKEIQLQQKQLQARQQEMALQYQKNKLRGQPNQKKQTKALPNQPNRQFLQNQQLQQKKIESQSNAINQQQLFQSQNIHQKNSLTKKQKNQQQGLKQKTSEEIEPPKNALNNSQNAQFKSKLFSPIPIQTSDISQKLISLAQMASMQNEANPNLKNIQAFTLEQINQGGEDAVQQEEVQEYQPQVEESQQQLEQQQQQLEQQQQFEQETATNEEQPQSDINIEALFITEEGRVIFRNGLLRGIIHRYAEIYDVVSKIQNILAKYVKFNLVYKAFDIWDKAKDFHEKCDKLNMSLVLIETDKDVRFGGFTTQSWEGHCLKKKDNNAFVFSLETNKIYDIIPNQPAIGCYPKFGPVFLGCQIRINDNFFTKGGTTCHKGLNYRTTEDYELNNGEQKFLIKDIEVYSIETIDI